jgi:hypothetical protein
VGETEVAEKGIGAIKQGGGVVNAAGLERRCDEVL